MTLWDYIDAHPVWTAFWIVVIGGTLVDIISAARGED